MKRLPLVLLASAAWVLPAAAADVVMEQPPAPPAAPVETAPIYSWSGFYIGGQLGAAFNNNDDSGLTFDPDGDGLNDAVNIFGDNNAGFAGGVHIGYDWQVNNWVIGGVADISYLDADVTRGFTGPAGGDFAVNQDVNFFGTVRGRLGYAFNRFLVYGTGGLAYADSDTTFSAPAGSTVSFDSDDADIGYTVGAGVDYLLTQNLSIGVEYLYTDLGDNDISFDTGPGGGTIDAGGGSNSFDFHTVWAKVSYRF